MQAKDFGAREFDFRKRGCGKQQGKNHEGHSYTEFRFHKFIPEELFCCQRFRSADHPARFGVGGCHKDVKILFAICLTEKRGVYFPSRLFA